tara:strand:- start:91 stop:1080 length:990 start_codon:yes stop_codon:yes gene_type:complete
MSSPRLICGDAIAEMQKMPDNSVDLIATDPPYFKVKSDAWDRQWDKPEGFLSWIGQLCAEWQRILKPNGSLYVFASPRMAARVECEIGKAFEVMNRIRWLKSAGWHNKTEKEALRSFLSPWEEVIFAEHFGADNMAKGEAGYSAKCDELRGFVFEPLRAYLAVERDRAGWKTAAVNDAWMAFRGTKGQMAGHWFKRVQWALPTEKNYEWLRELFNASGGEYLRREYEDLRRPFSVSADVPYTDVWDFPTVQAYRGKHPCEKPLAMMEHIIRASSRPGAVVLDCFMGSGTTGTAAVNLGRSFIGIELDEKYFSQAEARITGGQRSLFAAE